MRVIRWAICMVCRRTLILPSTQYMLVMRTIFFALALVSLSACNLTLVEERGNGNIITESRELSEFSSIDLRGGYEVHLTEGNEPGLEIETDDNLLSYIKTSVQGDKLIVESTARIVSAHGIVVNITYTDLEKVHVSGAVTLENFGTIAGESMNLSVSGAAEVELRVDVQELNVHTSGAGSISLKGEAQRANLQLSGAGGIEAYSLTTSYCDVQVSGVGGAEVYVTEELRAQVSGIGSISYKGNPSNVSPRVSGLGSVDSAD